ncbi:hypothetical protein DH2020_016656 [Rehmannia glutinosa]|uniref:Glycosyltransferase N-terminal domain-containing protein n=1 Tax=Rehmannia glutinosa TaxID=99300 RepID=A0ABR0WRA5_REHGL
MVPLPAQGHLNQLLHLSYLISAHNIAVYYAGAATYIRQAKLRLHGWDPPSISNINFHEFPKTPFENPNPNPHAKTKFPSQIMPSLNASLNLRGPVFDFVDGLSTIFRRVIVIFDSLMAYVVQDIDSIQNAECYSFRSISAFSVCSWEVEVSPDLPNILKELPSLDGYYPPEFSDFLNLQSGTRKIFSGEIYNSCVEIEGFCLDLLAKRFRNGTEKGPDSVIFVSFGTTSSFSDEQIKEIAFGLERSEQKFIWVLRDADKGDIFAGEARKAELPDGFEKRVKERGIIVRDWAPQLDILGHPSTESISMGVPIATWPLHSDQPANAVLITKVLKIGVEMKQWTREDELLSSSKVENGVRKLMESEEGDEIRKRASELGKTVRNSGMESGARRKEMDSFITHITR